MAIGVGLLLEVGFYCKFVTLSVALVIGSLKEITVATQLF